MVKNNFSNKSNKRKTGAKPLAYPTYIIKKIKEPLKAKVWKDFKFILKVKQKRRS